MSEREAMERAICAEPAEDTPRLAFADWLDEHGEPERAEFIRVQCGIASNRSRCCDAEAFVYNQFGGRIDCPKCLGSGERSRELLLAHSREWFKDAVPGGRVSTWSPDTDVPYFVLPDGRDFINVGIARGFINQVSLTAAVFAGDGIPCSACEEGHPDWETGVIECRNCDSTGVIFEACAGELFERHPITRVVLEDCAPDELLSGEFSWWARRDNANVTRTDNIPWVLFELLKGGEQHAPREKTQNRHLPVTWPYNRIYPTEADAFKDLFEVACVAFGRAQAAKATGATT